ncbi:Fic/DOC family protein [Ramlibacter sp. Leaf400]|uniref:Fic/DOC family protein n=1 Tax=Ramlibacter sp. Leaf400 TaxID=1736365 RepID=UPI0006F7ED41|nr:Fic family protein [Ramlibacter sp. Leaf400]KQT11025.1 cell filamentation protein [Ramlibacter sp. Leaf400]
MFDPFGDFRTAGYLRNVEGLTDLEKVKIQEHVFFEANFEEALAFLGKAKGAITYEHFLEVHRILFGEFYPWAGQDRRALGVGRFVAKGSQVQFEASERCQRAVEWGLQMGNDPATHRAQPGTVMGAFAWGHPFLDGNGRTMLLVHAELCQRAGFGIDWRASHKGSFLDALTRELADPAGKHLDRYQLPLAAPVATGSTLLDQLRAVPGLDGQEEAVDQNIAYQADDPQAIQTYLETKRARGEPLGDGLGGPRTSPGPGPSGP